MDSSWSHNDTKKSILVFDGIVGEFDEDGNLINNNPEWATVYKKKKSKSKE